MCFEERPPPPPLLFIVMIRISLKYGGKFLILFTHSSPYITGPSLGESLCSLQQQVDFNLQTPDFLLVDLPNNIRFQRLKMH